MAASTAAVVGSVVLVATGQVANPFQNVPPGVEQPDLTPLLDRVAGLEAATDEVQAATLDLAGDLAALDAVLASLPRGEVTDAATRDQVRDAVAAVRESVDQVESIAQQAADDATAAAAALATLPVDDLTGRIEGIDGALDLVATALDDVRNGLGAASTVADAAATAAAQAAQEAQDAATVAAEGVEAAEGAAAAAQAVADDLATLSDDVGLLTDEVEANATAVAEVTAKVDDLAAAVEQDRADVAVALSQLTIDLEAVHVSVPRTIVLADATAPAGEGVDIPEVSFILPGDPSGPGEPDPEFTYRVGVSANTSDCHSIRFEYDPNLGRWISLRTVTISQRLGEVAYADTRNFPVGVTIRLRATLFAHPDGECFGIAPFLTLQRVP